MKRSEAQALIKSKITIDSTGCWIWPTSSRYGHIMIEGKSLAAHRFSYRAFHGPIGEGHVCHSCDVPACVNPEHLFLGTHKSNMADMAAKDRGGGRAHKHPRAKFSDEQIREIRAKYDRGFPVSWLAAEYGTSQNYLRDIVKRRVKRGYELRYHADQPA